MKKAVAIKEFTDLHAWKESHKLVILTYSVTKKFPKEELFGLVNQMRRAAVSITSNIAEGFGRHSMKERVQFYYMAQGSLLELKNQFILARDINYLDENAFLDLIEQAEKSHRLLQGLLSKSKQLVSLAS